MPENEVKILVRVAGQNELNALIAKVENGTASINETAKAAKLATKVYRDWGTENNNLKPALASTIVSLKETVAKGVDPLTTANGRMMHSYFQTGEALRVQQAFAGFLSKGFQTLGMSTESATKASNNFGAALGMMVGVVGATVGAVMLLVKTFKIAETALRMELLQTTMQQMAKKDGVDFANVMQDIGEKTGGTISKVEILQGVMKLKLLDVGWQEMPRLLEFTKKRSDLLGMSFEDTLSILERASMGGQRAIKQLMIPVDVNQSYKDYAKTLHVSADELSDIGKQHALFQAILKKGEEQHLDINKAAEAELDKYERLDASWKDLSKSAGEFATALTPVVSIMSDMVKNMTATIEKGHWYFIFLDGYIKRLQDVSDPNRKFDIKKAIGSGNTISPEDYVNGVYQPAGGVPPEIANQPTVTPTGGKPGGKSGDVDWEKVNKRKAEEEKRLTEQEREDRAYLYDLNKNYDEAVEKEAKKKLDADRERYNELSEMVQANTEEELKNLKEVEKAREDEAKKRKRLEDDIARFTGSSESALFDGMMGGFSSMVSQMSSAWQGMWARNFGNTQTVVAIMINSIVEQFLAMAARMAALQIFKFIFPTSWASLLGFGMSTGGEVTTGGKLQIAAKGGDFTTGSKLQIPVSESTVNERLQSIAKSRKVTTVNKLNISEIENDISINERLQMAGSGINLKYDSTVQNVLVGDDGGKINKTTELMQVGRNGVRIIPNNILKSVINNLTHIKNAPSPVRIPNIQYAASGGVFPRSTFIENNNLQTINQMSHASRAGSRKMEVITKQLRTEIEGDKLVVLHQLTLQSRSDRVG